MITIRPDNARGTAKFDWLDSRHTFSFGHYYDPRHMGFGTLRVINEDRVGPGGGFATHGHQDMEIISYVLEGALEHKDSLGTGSIIRPGDVQRMTAGTGIRHSEFNHSQTRPVHFLQIWIIPERAGLEPGYEQRTYADKRNRLRLIASRDGRDGSVTLHQAADVFASLLEGGARLVHPLREGRRAWVQVARGAVRVDGVPLSAGDGAGIEEQPEIILEADEGAQDGGAAEGSAEILLFDLG
jgi:redox-sensitive bicupin YhaK (pirin superfamily)